LRRVHFLSIVEKMADVQHSIKAAAQISGLSPHVIRVWERRYDAVSPDRTDTNRRLYSEEEIERLTLLRQATEGGHSIGNIARLPTETLRKLTEQAQASHSVAPPSRAISLAAPEGIVEEALQATLRLNAAELESAFSRASVAVGHHGLLEKVIGPLAVKLGDAWRDGQITAAHEHFASAVIRNFLARHYKPYGLNGNTPTIVVGTPSGQLHELGAVMVAAAANNMGWRVVYLSTGMPAAEIAGAAIQNQARVVALSIVFPGDDPNLPGELEHLRNLLPPSVKLIVGGRAAESYRSVLTQLGAEHVSDLRQFYSALERLRLPPG
jgi:MerR family transcriptional regulator, light-induced transcriptional regulator